MRSLAILLALAGPAVGQQCGPYDALAARLASEYSEQPQSRGIDNAGMMIEVWADPKSGTCTIVTTSPRKLSCIIATCSNWIRLDPTPLGDDL